VVERITPAGPDLLRYEATIEDPQLYTRPWKISLPIYRRAEKDAQLFEYVESAEGRGLEVIVAAAGGAAHLAGVAAAKTLLPVLGVPMESKSLKGLDSLLSMVQMPAGIPVATLAIGRAGAVNAALFAAAILAITAITGRGADS